MFGFATRADPNLALAAVAHNHGGRIAQSIPSTAAIQRHSPHVARLETQPRHDGGGGVLGFLKTHVLKPVEDAAPVALPYIAGATVLGLCPECVLTAALAAGVTSYGTHKGIGHEPTGRALVTAAIDAAGEYGGDVAKKALIRQVDKLLAKNEVTAASNVMLGALLSARRFEVADEFHHR